MHEAYDLLPLLGSQHAASAVLAHAGKLYIGTPTGQLAVYSLPIQVDSKGEAEDDAPSSSSASTQTNLSGSEPKKQSQEARLELLETKQVGKKAVEMIGIVKECGMLLLLTESTVNTLELPLQANEPKAIASTKGALTFAIDTSVQRLPARQAQARSQARPMSLYNPNTLGRAFRPDAGTSSSTATPYATLRGSSSHAEGSRQAASVRAAGGTMRAGVRDMEALIREKQDRKERAREEKSTENAENVLVSTLAVGCRRRCVIMRWVDGAVFDTKEIALPHTPRSLAFPSALSLFMGYTPSSASIQPIPLALPMASWEVAREVNSSTGDTSFSNQHPSNSASGGVATGFGWGAGALTVLRGARNPIVRAALDGETMVQREQLTIFLGPDGSPARREAIEWPSVPDDFVFARPYVMGLLPAQGGHPPNLVIRSGQTLAQVQSIPLPLPRTDASSASIPAGSHAVLTTAGPKNAFVGTAEGAIFALRMRPWKMQVEELIKAQAYGEALSTLEGVDEVHLPDKPERKAYVEALWALDLFKAKCYDESLEHFLELDVNPCKIVALYPHSVAGNLSRRPEQWNKIFGAPEALLAPSAGEGASEIGAGADKKSGSGPDGQSEALAVPRARLGGLFARRPQSVYGAGTAGSPGAPSGSAAAAPSSSANPAAVTSPVSSPSKFNRATPAHQNLGAVQDDDAKSVRSVRSARSVKPPVPTGSPSLGSGASQEGPTPEEARRSLEALGRYLADRRRIFKPLLEVHPSSHTSSQHPRDSKQLLALPDLPMSSFDVDDLTAIAQAVDTALFKTFLSVKPALLGSLCRVENWCEVGQVEELLLDKERFSELIALYGGKNMHAKALRLLRNLGEEEEDEDEKIGPTIRYLQNLGPEHIDVILEASHWVLTTNPDLGMEVFCEDTGKVSELPRHAVVADLEKFDARLCIRYLRHIIITLGEGDPALHEKLALLLLRRVTSSVRAASTDTQAGSDRQEGVQQLASFLQLSHQYRAEKILSRLPASESDDDLLEIRALLLGRLGQHESALKIYVGRLQDHEKAEEYCRKVWNASAHTEWDSKELEVEAGEAKQKGKDVFLILLKLYLRASEFKEGSDASKADVALEHLAPALALISRQGARIDAKSALDLLPPLVPLQDILPFALKTLQTQSSVLANKKVLRGVMESRKLGLEEGLIRLRSRRVKVTEGRTCPRCLKRLGNSVIAVVNTNGAVLHYSCR
ncbi:hypothetical protein IE81DRAFT_321996 [Ceraceosorus guamensis]|uniref:CNH domain-containing protein n=1 Tax=Ceraceosorus guamensis TaxID=1522189 RepID=A0A316W2U8_9BASI|nr:hypothetical protein IE81DRAFT_321996 [Ceraceosorus guamensis]PWN43824.1 hypothetical protein IE81DRAFT_321996 [Ceraceosorus guamensis]